MDPVLAKTKEFVVGSKAFFCITYDVGGVAEYKYSRRPRRMMFQQNAHESVESCIPIYSS
jgi:hypothetical protein